MREFYRAIHPDLFEKAPAKVKEENERSLKQLNNYMDCLKKNQGSTSVLLKFYATNKDNAKAKKFLYFQVELPSFLANSAEDTLALNETNAVKKLRTSLYSVQVANNPFAKHAKEVEEREFTEPNFEVAHPEAFIKSSSKMSRTKELFKMRDEFLNMDVKKVDDQVISEIQRAIKMHYPTIRRSGDIAQEVHADLESQRALQSLQDAKIDLRIFYVDQTVEPSIITSFLEKTGERTKKDPAFQSQMKVIQSFCLQQGPKLKIMLGDKFGVLPGMVVIDCREPPADSFGFATQKFDEALEMRATMFEGDAATRQINDFVGLLKKDFGLAEVRLSDIVIDASVEDDTHKKSLFLKKLARVCMDLSQGPRKELLSGLTVELAPKGVEIDRQTNCWRLCWNFDDVRLLKKVRESVHRKSASESPWST